MRSLFLRSDPRPHLAEGWTVEAVLAEYPQLEVADVRACIAYGAQLADVRFADLDAAG